MFTPQRKGWSLSPRVAGAGERSNPRSVAGSVLGKGKAVAGSMDGGGSGGGGGGDVEVWKRFREEGLLDESALQKKDREALAGRISELEKELHEYQYNMGLLLIEKKEWSASYDDLRQRLLEAEEILKREQAAHLIAISESEKREENLKKVLGVEKQCVTDLEKAMREMRAEIAEVKFTADKKLGEANALEASLEEKCLEVDRKLHSADAKLAEASRRSSEIGRISEAVEARERKLQRELLSLNTERKAHEKVFAEQREHLLAWEKKLQDGQMRLVDGQRLLNEREDRANESDKVLKKKEEGLEEARRLIDTSTSTLKNKEDEVNLRLRAVATKGKDADLKLKDLEKKEKDLLALEEKLNAREREEIQKLVDEHNAVLDAKNQEFELEMDEKRKSFNKELSSKLDSMDKEKKELKRKEEQITKRETALEEKNEKHKNKEKDLDTKSKALAKWEESVKVEETKLEEQRKQILNESQELVVSKTELESLRAAVKAEEQKIVIEKEKLELTSEEREQHVKLQSDLKQEIEECRLVKESVINEQEALKNERETFEREWEIVDEKRCTLGVELEKFSDERNMFEKWLHTEQEILKSEGLHERADIQRELDDLRLNKEAFENTMEHERSEAHEEARRALADIARELEIRKHDLEMNMQTKQEEMDKLLREKGNEFEKTREAEWNRINSSVHLNDSKFRKLKVEQDKLEREKEEHSVNRKKMEADQADIQKDIDTLHMLSRNLKDQREEFIRERDCFLKAAGQCKVCHNCGVPIRELEIISLEPTSGIPERTSVLPRLAGRYVEHMKDKQVIQSQCVGSQSVNSGGRMSWLQKCSRLFTLSPGKNAEHSTVDWAEIPIQFGERLDMAVSEDETDYGVANNLFDTQRGQSDGGGRGVDELERLNHAGDEPEPSLGVAENSIDIGRAHSDYDFRETEGETTIPSTNEPNEMEGSSVPLDSQPQPTKQRRRQPSRRGKSKTTITRSVKAVVEDAKAFLGEASELELDREANGNAQDSQNMDEESQGASLQADSVSGNTRPKRRRPTTSGMTNELEADDSEAQTESMSLGGLRKRRNTGPALAPREKRYNLRGTKVASTVAATTSTSKQAKGHTADTLPENQIARRDHAEAGTSKYEAEEDITSMHMLQKSAAGNVIELLETSSQILIRCEPPQIQHQPQDPGEGDLIKSVELSEGTEEEGDEVDGAAAVPTTPSGGESSEDEDVDEEDEKMNASVGKKLWKFFTS